MFLLHVFRKTGCREHVERRSPGFFEQILEKLISVFVAILREHQTAHHSAAQIEQNDSVPIFEFGFIS